MCNLMCDVQQQNAVIVLLCPSGPCDAVEGKAFELNQPGVKVEPELLSIPPLVERCFTAFLSLPSR